MNITEEIQICANLLANAGKKPTVALIKGKLSKRVPLPTIIQTLKTWKHDPLFTSIERSEKESINIATGNTSQVNDSDLEERIKVSINQVLEKELADIKDELADMKLLIKTLTEQLK
jgi:hypothetical protein